MWDVLKWFLGIFFALFFIWILTGGPTRGTGDKPFVNPPSVIR